MEIAEIWKDIKGYPEYQISNKGRIWSKYRNRYKSTWINNRGYEIVNLIAVNGKWKHESVHRLVALTFIDNPEHKPEVNHINHIRDDNRMENLEWVTHGENNTVGRKQHYTHSEEWFNKRHSKHKN